MEREKERQGEGERECEKEKRKTEKQIQQFWDRLSGKWPAQEPGSSEHLNDMNWWSSSLEHSVLNLPPISVCLHARFQFLGQYGEPGSSLVFPLCDLGGEVLCLLLRIILAAEVVL